jgi:DNA-binding transcriptional regulator YiaG
VDRQERRREYARAYQRKKRLDPTWQARYLQANRANKVVAYAIKHGKLTRPTHCAQCLAEAFVEASHRDYSKPLEVAWLCRPCHRAEDKQHPKTQAVPISSQRPVRPPPLQRQPIDLATLRERIVREDLSQVELAQIMGVNKSTVWRWLHGRSRPRTSATVGA